MTEIELIEEDEENPIRLADLENLTNTELDSMEKELLIGLAQNYFDADGFSAFYKLLFGIDPPTHVRYWMLEIFDAMAKKEHILLEAFRGSTKSTTLITFITFFIGHRPMESNLVIGAGDQDAQEISSLVANFISYNSGWKSVFPNIVPDKKQGWGKKTGYEVKDKSMKYSKWREERQKRGRAATLIGVGYKSTYLPGPHPTGMLLIDDIHNEANTRSAALLLEVKTIYTGTVLPMIGPTTFHAQAGTPWKADDVIARNRNSSAYRHVLTPIYQNASTDYIPEDPDIKPTWPEKWPKEQIEKKRAEINNKIEFSRMYDLDLEGAKGLVLKRSMLNYFPYEQIRKDWDTYIGIDYTSTANPNSSKVDYFALAVGKLIPGGQGVVIVDGIRIRLGQAEAEQLVATWATSYPYLKAVLIEAIITGKEFLNIMMRSPLLLDHGIVAEGLTGGPFSKKKGVRFETILAPAFQSKQVYLSTIESQFITDFESEWVGWEGDAFASAAGHHDDAMDAVFNVVWKCLPYLEAKYDREKQYPQNPLYNQKPREDYSDIGNA